LGVVALLVRSRQHSRRLPPDQATRTGHDVERVALLEDSLKAVENGLREAPRDRWDPDYVIRTVGKDPQVLFRWVRDNTSWIPYRGELRGPVGVLMDRQGNALDRALLLATLLERSGHRVRLARGQLTRDDAAAVLPELLVAHPTGASVPDAPPPRAARVPSSPALHVDERSVERILQAQRRAVGDTVVELHTRLADQVARLLRVVPAPADDADWTERFESALEALEDHWWVQIEDAGTWGDLELLPGDDWPARRGVPVSTIALADTPPELRHDLTIRLVVEQWNRGNITETRVIDRTICPCDMPWQTLMLQIWPGDWPQEIHPDPNSKFGLRGWALEQKRWTVSLRAGDTTLAQGIVDSKSQTVDPGGAAGLGGLGAGITGIAKPATSGQEMTAAWIEYVIRSPAGAPRVIRRPIFDLLGPAVRAAGPPRTLVLDEDQRLARSLALMLHEQMLPVTSRLAPAYVAFRTANSLVANKDVLRMLARASSAPDLLAEDALLKSAAPAVSPLLSLALARTAWNPFADREYVDRIGVISRHSHPAIGPAGVGMRGATDVVAGDTGVALTERSGFALRLARGVFDSNAEALWWMGPSPETTGEAWKTPAEWQTITPSHKERIDQLRLSDDTRARIRQDLDKGLLVVTPREPVPIGAEHFSGWWRVDPRTGRTTGVSGATTGECGSEYGMAVRAVLLQAAEEFAMETVLCHGMAQAFNQFVGIMSDLQRAGYVAWWTPQIAGASDPLTVAKNNAGICLVGAIAKGMLSTTALLPFLIRGAEESEAAIVAAQSRQTLTSLDNFVSQSPLPRISTDPSFVEAPTQRYRLPDLRETVPSLEPMPPTARGITTGLSEKAALEQLRAANAAVKAAQSEYYKSINDFLKYRQTQGLPLDAFDGALQRDVRLKEEILDGRIRDLRAAQAELQAAAAATPASLPGPNLYQMAAGQAGVSASTFWEIPWPR
jgi:hypothetical protein